MAAAGQQDMTTNLLAFQFKLNETRADWAECLPLKSPKELSSSHKSPDHVCKYKKSMISIGSQKILALL